MSSKFDSIDSRKNGFALLGRYEGIIATALVIQTIAQIAVVLACFVVAYYFGNEKQKQPRIWVDRATSCQYIITDHAIIPRKDNIGMNQRCGWFIIPDKELPNQKKLIAKEN